MYEVTYMILQQNYSRSEVTTKVNGSFDDIRKIISIKRGCKADNIIVISAKLV